MSFCSVDEINRSLFAFQIETYHWNLSMDAEINDSPGTLITNSGAIFRFQYNTQAIWTWSQPLHISSSANTIVPIIETISASSLFSFTS